MTKKWCPRCRDVRGPGNRYPDENGRLRCWSCDAKLKRRAKRSPW